MVNISKMLYFKWLLNMYYTCILFLDVIFKFSLFSCLKRGLLDQKGIHF